MVSATSRDILSENLTRMIASSKLTRRGWAIGKGLDVKLVERLVKGGNAVTLDKLEQVASACGLQAWHLLIPDLDPNNPPAANITDEDRAMLAKLRRLLDEQSP